MEKNYIDIPLFTTLEEMKEKNYTLSATQYKSLCIPNQNIKPLSYFLDRELTRADFGTEVGSESYVETSSFQFIKTKALQAESYLLDTAKDAIQNITPHHFIKMNLKREDLLLSKDSNVGEIVILDKDYRNAMLCAGLVRLPVSQNKYYLLAFIKSDIFRQQIDFLVPRGSTIRHGKTKFLDCFLPLPNKNANETIQYVELLTKAIINKEIEIRKKHALILQNILDELAVNQKENSFVYQMPTLHEIMSVDRFDSNRYSEEYKKFRFLITNYKYGYATLQEYGYQSKRGQNLQVSSIGKSVYSKEYYDGFYTLVLSHNLSKEGRILNKEYLGNKNELSTLEKGNLVFSARGQCLGRSFVVIEDCEKLITNIDSIVFYGNPNIQKSCFIHLMLDLYRSNDFIKKIAINGSGAESVTKYQLQDIPFPNFPAEKEKAIVKLYHNKEANYEASHCTLQDFLDYDDEFNCKAGIYELDKTMNVLKEKLNRTLDYIINDEMVELAF